MSNSLACSMEMSAIISVLSALDFSKRAMKVNAVPWPGGALDLNLAVHQINQSLANSQPPGPYHRIFG